MRNNAPEKINPEFSGYNIYGLKDRGGCYIVMNGRGEEPLKNAMIIVIPGHHRILRRDGFPKFLTGRIRNNAPCAYSTKFSLKSLQSIPEEIKSQIRLALKELS